MKTVVRAKDTSNSITWNGKYYVACRMKNGWRYFKSDNCRFDNTYGKTEEIDQNEYSRVETKYYSIFD